MKNLRYTLLGALSLILINNYTTAQSLAPNYTLAPSSSSADKPTPSPGIAQNKVLIWSEGFNIGGFNWPASTPGPTFTTSNGIWTTGGTNGDIWKHSFYTTSGEWSGNTGPFASTTAGNGFMLFDADSVNFPLSPNYQSFSGELISPTINLTTAPTAVLEFEQDFRYCCSGFQDFITISVSTDNGATWGTPHDVTYGTAVNDDYLTSNGNSYITLLNITTEAAGQANVKLKFNFDGNLNADSHYYWNFDDLSISTLPDDDLHALSAFIVGTSNDDTYYGRTPVDHIDANYLVGSEVTNWGVNLQTAVALNATYTGISGFTSNSSVPSIVSGDTVVLSSLELGLLSSAAVDLYTGSHVVSSFEEQAGPTFGNNTRLRNFEITDYWYSQDLIGSHPAGTENLSSDGTASWIGEADGPQFATMYHIKQATEIASLRVMLGSQTVPGGFIEGFISDTTNALQFNSFTPLHVTNFVQITAADTTNGYVDLVFPGGAALAADAWFAGVTLYSNGNANDIYVLDDQTVEQPIMASAIYLPSYGNVYTNGNSYAIRMLEEDCPGFSVNILDQTNACFGQTNGTAVAQALGAPGPYVYEWSNGVFNDTLVAAPGNYDITITAPGGCEANTSITIIENTQIQGDVFTTDEMCDATNDGTATVNIWSGGVAPITYLWNTTETTPSITGLDGGNYSVTATDADGCTFSTSGTVNTGTVDFSLAVSANPTSGAAPLNVIFDNQTPNLGNYNFTWIWGDGNTELNNSSFVQHIYASGGLWDVTLIAVDIVTGCSDTLYLNDYIFTTGATAPIVSFDQSSVTYNENAGTISANVTITTPNANPTSVDVALGGGTATSGVDFTYTPTTVTFPAGSSATQSVTLAIIDDAIVEPSETIILNLQNPTNSAIINPNTSQTINITDNDVVSAPTLSFDQSSVTVNENAGTISANVTIANPNGNATSVDVALGGGTASSGLDFTFSPTTVTFPAGSSATQTVTLTIIDDAVVEPSETIILNLLNATNSATINPNLSQTINITDNDTGANPTVSFDVASVSVNEGAGTIMANITIASPDANPTTVDVVLGASTATIGVDFSYTTPTTVTFPAGSSATQTVVLGIIDDVLIESTEDIVLNLTNPTNNANISPNGSHTISIIDNEAGPDVEVSFDAASVTVDENAGTVMVDVTIANPDANPTSVDVVLGASTATIGTDFTFSTPTTVTFPAGSSVTQSVVVGIIDDATVEGTENIVLNIQNPTNSAIIGANGSHTIEITDNDGSSGLEEEQIALIMIHPNPTTGQVNIITDGVSELMKITLLNTQGQIVREYMEVNKEITIDISDVSSGIYYLNVQADNINRIRKIVKQ